MVKKVDSRYRFGVPKDMLLSIGVDKYDEVNVDLRGNEIIITKHENRLEAILDTTETILNTSRTPRKDDDIINNKDRDVINNKDRDKLPKYKPDDVFSFDGEAAEFSECSRCGRSTLGSVFKLNNEPICTLCFKDMKKQILKEVKYGHGKRLKSE